MHGVSPISGVRHSVGCDGGVAGETVSGGGVAGGGEAGTDGVGLLITRLGGGGEAGTDGGGLLITGVGGGEEAGTDGGGLLITGVGGGGREATGGGGDGITTGEHAGLTLMADNGCAAASRTANARSKAAAGLDGAISCMRCAEVYDRLLGFAVCGAKNQRGAWRPFYRREWG